MSEPILGQDQPLARNSQAFSGLNDTTAAADTAQFITFAVGEDHYGIDIVAVREIKNWTEIRYLPHQPEYVRGICALRGAFIPIVDLRCRFGLGLTEPTSVHVFLIVQIGQQLVGLLADSVSDIISVARADIKPVPKVGEARALGFLSGLVRIDDATVGLIDLDNVLGMNAQVPDIETLHPERLSA